MVDELRRAKIRNKNAFCKVPIKELIILAPSVGVVSMD